MSALPISEISIQDSHDLVPPVAGEIEAPVLPESTLEQLIFKLLYFKGDLLGRDVSNSMGLKFSLIQGIIDSLKRQHLLQVKRSLGMGESTALFTLTEAGRTAAREYLDNNQYSGPAPVPLYQYASVVRRQRRQAGWLKLGIGPHRDR